MAIVNVNITNCNCCGGSSSSGSSDSGNDVFDGDLAETSTDPPRGYSQSAVSGRPCKTAIWIYNWVHAWLGYLSDFSPVFSAFTAFFIGKTVGQFIIQPLARVIGGIIGAVAGLIGTPGLTPDDPVTVAVASKTAELMVDNAVQYGVDKLTDTMIETAVTTLETNRDGFICAIASGGTPNGAASKLKTYLAADYPQPVQWLIYNLATPFFNLAFFAADWWPGFEDEIAGITETCCAGLTDGTPIEAGSAQACAGANFILDNLVGCLTTADSYVQEYSRTTYNSVTATESLMLNNVQSGFSVPGNVQNKAWSFPLMQAELARYMWAKLGGESWLTPGVGVNTWEMGRLAAHMQTEIAICELRDAETAQTAYELLAAAIDAWLSANVTDQALVNHIRLFCQGLIHPSGVYIGLLFTESADLAGFAGSSDCVECDDSCHALLEYGTNLVETDSYVQIDGTANPSLWTQNALGFRFVNDLGNPCGKNGTITVLNGSIDTNNGYCGAYLLQDDGTIIGSPGQHKSFSDLQQWIDASPGQLYRLSMAYNDIPVTIRFSWR